MKTQKNFIIISFVTIAAFLLIGCGGGEQYGQEVPANMEVTPINKILANPQAYAEKEVRLEGTLGQVCPAGCWFFLHETGETKLYIDINPAGIAIPPNSKGKVSLFGTVKVAGTRIGIYGKGVKIL